MAKRKNGTNMSEAVRSFLGENPEATAKDVVSTLNKSGIKVKPNLVYFVMGKLKGKKQRKARVVRAAQAASTNGTAGKTDPITMIREVKALALKAGGYGKLKALVEALAE